MISVLILAGAVAAIAWYLAQSVRAFLHHRPRKGYANLKRAGITLGTYVLLLFGLAFASRPVTVPIGEAKCFGAWCATVTKALVSDGQVFATVRLGNKSRDASATPSGPRIYAIDSRNRSAAPGHESGPPLTATLAPGESVTKDFTFYLQPDSEQIRVVIQEGSWLTSILIGHDNSLLHARPGTPAEH